MCESCMTIQNIKSFSTGFGISSALISNWAILSQYKAGKIHIFYETLSRYAIVVNSVTFTKIVLEKLSYIHIRNQLQSKPIKWAIYLAPIAIGYLKNRTKKKHPLLAKNLALLENCVEKSSYVIFMIGSVALVHFGHLFVGYSALSILGFNQIISNHFVKSHFRLLDKVDSVFKIYANPIVGLAGVAISGSYLAIGYSLFSFALMIYVLFIKPDTIQKPVANKLTLEKWKKFNTEGEKTFLTINRRRIPKITLSLSNKNIDAKRFILDILEKLPTILQPELITRINHLPSQTNINTFEEAKSIATNYLDKLIAFTKQQSNSIWNTLLQQSCLMLQQVNNPDEKFLGIKELLFGNEGQCEIAQQKNLISGFIELAKLNQVPIDADELELIFNICLADLYNDNFSLFLEAHLNKSLLSIEKAINLPPVINFLKERMNLADMHNRQIYEKLYGSYFGIQSFTKDLNAESLNANLMHNPLLCIFMNFFLKSDTEKVSDIYFTTHLQKIIFWLRHQIALKQFFKPQDIGAWFLHWTKKLSISEEEYTEKGTIAGYQVCEMDSGNIKPIALIAFLYGMGVFTEATSSTDQEEASIYELVESLEPTFDLQMKTFEEVLNNLNTIGIENPSLAKTHLLGYLFFSERSLQKSLSQFIDSLSFSKQDHIPIEEQKELIDLWRDKASQLKEKVNKMDSKTRINLKKHLHNLIDLNNLDPGLSGILFT